MTYRQRAVQLLSKEPYLTAWEISIELGVRVSTISSILYRDTLRPFGLIDRRLSDKEKRGHEYFIRRM